MDEMFSYYDYVGILCAYKYGLSRNTCDTLVITTETKWGNLLLPGIPMSKLGMNEVVPQQKDDKAEVQLKMEGVS